MRDILLNRLKQDLVGPYTDDEVLTARPSDVYLTGILWPRESRMGAEEDEHFGLSGAGESETDSGGHKADCKKKDRADLYLRSERSGLAGLILSCGECKAWRSMDGVFSAQPARRVSATRGAMKIPIATGSSWTTTATGADRRAPGPWVRNCEEQVRTERSICRAMCGNGWPTGGRGIITCPDQLATR